MDGLIKCTFKVSQDVKNKLLSGEYKRAGGIIREPASGKIACYLTERADEQYSGPVVALRLPGILSVTLSALTFDALKIKYAEFIKKEAELLNNGELLECLSKMGESVAVLGAGEKGGGPGGGEVAEAVKGFEDCYVHFKELYFYNLGIADTRSDFKSFPVLKICMYTSLCLALLYFQLKKYHMCAEWLEEAMDLVMSAMKKYPTVFSKHITDVEHYVGIAALPPGEYIKELKDIIMSPAEKPKIKFPPMEVIYLWSCYEYFEGYIYEVNEVAAGNLSSEK